jgi:hypothetical protein
MNPQVTEHKDLLASSPVKLTPEELGNQVFLDPGLDEPRDVWRKVGSTVTKGSQPSIHGSA